MRFLFVHHAFPGIFGPLLSALAQEGGHELFFISSYSKHKYSIPGVQHIRLAAPEARTRTPFQEYEKLRLAGRQGLQACQTLARSGFFPDMVFSSAGCGYGLFRDEVYPCAFHVTWTDGQTPLATSTMPEGQYLRALAQYRQLLGSDLVVELAAGQFGFWSRVLKNCLDLPCPVNTSFFAPGQPDSLPEGLVPADHAEVTAIPVSREQAESSDFARGLSIFLGLRPAGQLLLLCDAQGTMHLLHAALAALPKGLSSRIHVLGPLTRKTYKSVLQYAHFFVLPPGSCCAAQTMLEAMSCATAVVLPASCTDPDIFRDRETVLAVPAPADPGPADTFALTMPNNCSDYFQAAANVLGNFAGDPPALAGLQQRARDMVVQRFDAVPVVRLHVRILREAYTAFQQGLAPAGYPASRTALPCQDSDTPQR